jgi:hypothetical protein
MSGNICKNYFARFSMPKELDRLVLSPAKGCIIQPILNNE